MRALVVLVASVGCGFTPASAPGDGSGSACSSVCVGADLNDCTGGSIACPLGCVAAEARCESPVPSNGVTSADVGAGDLAVSKDATMDTTTGKIVEDVSGVVLRPAGAGISVEGLTLTLLGTDRAVLGLQNMKVFSGATLHAAGPRSLIIIAAHDIIIEGVLDVSAGLVACSAANQSQCPGPGGGNGGAPTSDGIGCAPGKSGSTLGGDETGGGGGGFATSGAAGGNGGNPGGLGGTGTCSVPKLDPIIGGSGGGGGSVGGTGGGGGGAVQLTALEHVTIQTTGGSRAMIKANGAGGRAGAFSVGGGAGGSGGAILLEGQYVMIDDANVVANGGGGGAGNGGTDGNSGSTDETPALGGTGGRFGGSGGAKLAMPTQGFGGGDGTGGGGGSVGRIFINAGVYTNTGVTSPLEVQGTPAGI